MKPNSQNRFAFGKNWKQYLEKIDDDRVQKAVESLREMLDLETLEGKKFLDIGSGSGLFSLAAHRLGAAVLSFDYDANSVEATQRTKEKFAADCKNWVVQRGDVLDNVFVSELGTFDIVYSWGVLHHTGNMWTGIENAIACVAPKGQLFIALYNDQGGASKRWATVKKTYVASPDWLKRIIVLGNITYFETRYALIRLVRLKNPLPDWNKRERDQHRGMSVWHDYIDWVGGYPFEVSKPDDVFSLVKARGFKLDKLKTVGGSHGCNEYVFSRV